MLAAALLGGVANPIYALLIAYTNDRLDTADMAAASAGLIALPGGRSVPVEQVAARAESRGRQAGQG